ncbi:hypothetical protein HaLaN_24619 [Haematococcus lacustris]|uniref:Uncharacterized protein n=1 Tax=Haematococcus lacustris TaxID=44745 RepID=A0A699ZWV8_HAELA|nr:hypothetical protein HaLaN_24619 [Haematococcus lacustris]
MGATSKDIRAALAAYQPFAFDEFVTLGQHVADSMERESGIKSRWAVPVYRLRHWAAPLRPSNPGTATPGSSVPQMRHSSSEPSVRSKASSGAGSGPGAICQQYLTVQGKMDGRRALVPLWAALAEAGMAGNDSALCVKVLGASRSQRPEELPALLSVPDQLASRVQAEA